MVFVPNKEDIIYQHIDEEIILLNLKNGNYFSLNGAGRIFWEGICRGISAETILSTLETFTVLSSQELHIQVANLLMQLEQEGLVMHSDAPDNPSDDYRKLVAELSGADNFSWNTFMLHSYKNIQEKYAHPAGIKEI